MAAAARRLRAEVGGALSPSAAYEVVMDQYLHDPEAFRYAILWLWFWVLG